jgi:hypothetical protein
MVRRKIKGTKVRRTPTEEPNFYHPAWKNFFGAIVTEELKAKAYNVVPPAHTKLKNPTTAASTVTSTESSKPDIPEYVVSVPSRRSGTTSDRSANVVNFVDILPAPPRHKIPVAAPVSDEESSWDSSWDSLDLNMLEDGSIKLDSCTSLNGDMFMFEGDPFHFLDDIGANDNMGNSMEDQVLAQEAI